MSILLTVARISYAECEAGLKRLVQRQPGEGVQKLMRIFPGVPTDPFGFVSPYSENRAKRSMVTGLGMPYRYATCSVNKNRLRSPTSVVGLFIGPDTDLCERLFQSECVQ
jgi:hypothetical protein